MPKNALQQTRDKVGSILDEAGCQSTGAMWCNFNNKEYPSVTQIWVKKILRADWIVRHKKAPEI